MARRYILFRHGAMEKGNFFVIKAKSFEKLK